MNQNELNTENLKVGDFIKAGFKCGIRYGIVEKIRKDIVVIRNCTPYYHQYTLTNQLVNITKKRIWGIGLNENEIILK